MTELSAPQKAIVFDLDGTLSDGKHRLHLLPTAGLNINQSWDEFNLASKDDTPLQDNIDLCNILGLTHRIMILTGRSAIAKDITVAWLDKHGVDYDNLIMRGENDHRKDVDFKESVLLPLKEHILCAFDDLEHVAEHIRGLGITCHLVTKYDKPLAHQVDHRKDCDHILLPGGTYKDMPSKRWACTCVKCGEKVLGGNLSC